MIWDEFTIFDWSPSFGIGRRGRRLLERGEPATAVIRGIRVTRTGDSDAGTNSNHHAYALDVRTGIGFSRLGCRQMLAPHRNLLHIGSEVQVRHAKDRVIIDWTETLRRLGKDHSLGSSADWWKPLGPSSVPGDGVEDHEQRRARKRIAQGTPAMATVLRVNELTGGLLGGRLANVDVDVQLRFSDGTTSQGLLRRIIPPDYAAYLLKVGTVLPVGVDEGGERITVDWLAAVNGGASTDPSPPAAVRDPSAPVTPTQVDQVGGVLQGLVGKVLDAGGMPTEAPAGAEVPFETFVEVSAQLARAGVPAEDHDAVAQKFGVAPGAWGPGSLAWHSRMARDWQLAAKYGHAYQEAFQRLG